VEDESWPQRGEIEVKDLDFRYRPKLDLVLKQVSFKIQAGEKIGVVGRTAAGKSTLTLALMRLIESERGQILIDGINILDVNLQQVREMITIIPQEQTLFRGNLRYNIDPQKLATDGQILDLLQKAGLTELIMNIKKTQSQSPPDDEQSVMTDEGANDLATSDSDEKLLNLEIYSDGSNLSSGEKSLICICRAILKKNKIILLDEATANIDIVTEQNIQQLIESEFKDCTMITIAHRLQTVMKSDRVFVMGEKRIVEQGRPADLMRDPKSKFQFYLRQMQSREQSKRHTNAYSSGSTLSVDNLRQRELLGNQ